MTERSTIQKFFEIPRRDLGATGEKVSIIGLGGAHTGWQSTEHESIEIIRTAIDRGVNFLDNSWDYNDGVSELRMGKALQDGYRKQVFLMTKIDGRSRQGASRQIDESLKRLQTDYIDLMQIHEVIRLSDADMVFASGGAIEALTEARKAGKIRFIGFTGHKSPDIHLKMLQTAMDNGFRFDTVQMPLNVLDAHFESFENKVLPLLLEHGIGIIGMKSLAEGHILKTQTVTARECLQYTMSLPVSVTVTGCDSMKILEQALSVATQFQPLTDVQRASLLAKTAFAARNGQYEPYKTGDFFDATKHNPQWLD